jgi:hypothetical protein
MRQAPYGQGVDWQVGFKQNDLPVVRAVLTERLALFLAAWDKHSSALVVASLNGHPAICCFRQ